MQYGARIAEIKTSGRVQNWGLNGIEGDVCMQYGTWGWVYKLGLNGIESDVQYRTWGWAYKLGLNVIASGVQYRTWGWVYIIGGQMSLTVMCSMGTRGLEWKGNEM